MAEIATRQESTFLIVDLPTMIQSDKLQEVVKVQLAAQQKRIAINLANITFVESSGLGALVAVHKLCESAGCRVGFVAPQPYVRKLVEVTKLDRVLRFYDDEPKFSASL